MLTYALIAFAVAAVGGLVLAAHVLRGKLAPWALSLLHAALGATGLALLLLLLLQGSVQGAVPQAVLIAFIVLVVAALGGVFLASFHLRRRLPLKTIVGLHAGLAVTGFLILLSQVV
jgi:hypothetical protein